jgi:hypothetical protein
LPNGKKIHSRSLASLNPLIQIVPIDIKLKKKKKKTTKVWLTSSCMFGTALAVEFPPLSCWSSVDNLVPFPWVQPENKSHKGTYSNELLQHEGILMRLKIPLSMFIIHKTYLVKHWVFKGKRNKWILYIFFQIQLYLKFTFFGWVGIDLNS